MTLAHSVPGRSVPASLRWGTQALATGLHRLRHAPGTLGLLALISVTSIVLVFSSAAQDHELLHHFSSNLAHIEHLRFGVLLGSAFWLEDSLELLPWLFLFLVVAAPAELWLGTGRWLIVFAAGHVGATLGTLAGIWIAIQAGAASNHLARTVDVGVSYGFFAIVAILTYRVPRRWRPIYLAVALAYPLWGALVQRGFTDYGHLLAFGIGLALYPLARTRPSERG